jgi:UDPglucose 6-dehydrogenase
MNNAVVIGGLGMVGNATRHAFGIDKYIDLKESTSSYKEAGSSKYVFICVPTPTINGECKTDDIKEAIRGVLAHQSGQPIFIIRSTVTPGTCKYLMEYFNIQSIVHNPEFLSEATWQSDTEHPDVVVIGGENAAYIEDVAAVYKGRFKGVNIIKTDTVTAEMIKYSINSFYATKVVFANQIYDHAKKIGANYEAIKNAMYSRKWIGKNHLDVWHNDKRGAGGKCLEKDLESFAEYTQLPLLKKVNDLNKIYLGTGTK